jgi:hypothetical protein
MLDKAAPPDAQLRLVADAPAGDHWAVETKALVRREDVSQ